VREFKNAVWGLALESFWDELGKQKCNFQDKYIIALRSFGKALAVKFEVWQYICGPRLFLLGSTLPHAISEKTK